MGVIIRLVVHIEMHCMGIFNAFLMSTTDVHTSQKCYGKTWLCYSDHVKT